MIILHKDLKEFLKSFNDHRVNYLVVGGYAVGIHGRPRYTGDLDIFIEASPANAKRVADSFQAFGFDPSAFNAAAFEQPNRIIDLGREPVKIQVMTSISGVSFEECLRGCIRVQIDGLEVPFIGYEQLIKNKSATGRSKDLADVDELNRGRPGNSPDRTK